MNLARWLLAAVALLLATEAAAAEDFRDLALIPKAVYRERTGEHPRVPDLVPQYLACLTLLQKHRYEGAEQVCGRLAVLDPLSADAHRMYGAARLGLRKYAPAREELVIAISRDPDDADSYALLAASYREERRYRLAIANFTTAIRKRPEDARLWNGRCWVRAVGGFELTRAMSDCWHALLLRADPNTLDSMGFVSLRRAQFGEALRFYGSALVLDPTLATSLFGRGLAKWHLQGVAAGRSDVAAALKLDPSAGETFFAAHLIEATSPLLPCPSCRRLAPRPNAPKVKKPTPGPVEVTKL